MKIIASSIFNRKWLVSIVFLFVSTVWAEANLSKPINGSSSVKPPAAKDQATITLSKDPQMRLYKNFISEDEARHLIAIAKSRLAPSTVLKYGARVKDEWRTSSTAFLNRSEDPIVKRIEERVCRLLNCKIEQMEPLQIIHYIKGQKFSPHYDYFTEQEVKYQTGQRLHTMLVYLNSVDETHGGMTLFPNLNMHIQPNVGTALYFKNLHDDGKVNPLTLHGGEPIISDGVEKWACNIWVRNNTYVPAPEPIGP